jgi:hypothetical protein
MNFSIPDLRHDLCQKPTVYESRFKIKDFGNSTFSFTDADKVLAFRVQIQEYPAHLGLQG